MAAENEPLNNTGNNESHNNWSIALYYCYIEIEEVDKHVDFHRSLCDELSLLGRIRVSQEGINGVLSGRVKACQSYEEKVNEELLRLVPDKMTWELDLKYCLLRADLPANAQLFHSLVCKAANSVVSLFDPNMSNYNNNKNASYCSRHRRRQQQRREQKLLLDQANDIPNFQEIERVLGSFPGGRHLSPQEWNEKLCSASDAVLLDCRNVYECNIGHFVSPDPQKAPTILTNTRKYSDLPKVLALTKDQWVHKKQIFMYCTGGVRCEQASKFVQALVAKEKVEHHQEDDVQVYQLHGGIQRYLEQFHNAPRCTIQEGERLENHDDPESGEQANVTGKTNTANVGSCLYRGLNFVFDPRRTDPMVHCDSTATSCVGKCCLCRAPHDDYDDGHSPVENQEARCWKCRILLLVCHSCRQKVQCWGEDHKDGLPKLFCGIDTCSDYQATGHNPATIVSAPLPD